ncbi:thiamine/thiamine pyrophosphate ABC transporter permease ThiP [Marinovum sp. 2_MG-2023]|uniref:thiamine/thiamine pyrophosphate ABC transporter permease ThiP n=1 Tax=unclassified Marinovum TaxID=2647166 RepID=UPI0026E2F9DA|nr:MULTISPECIES: thiamine/thiamine pyrophosphate ABC transporter permease ThiP [unclassified Marinovum]MDO6729885.1 thiamine/thiamine pyrophosphate ABC transporter permease ThiP [Marinovum sp. 2_MG-2023]MDO6779699.1 thiamine/thiamine pyrophosphate ABC transporter permease ThiP [Marinovum sp. 1_MG-2023]
MAQRAFAVTLPFVWALLAAGLVIGPVVAVIMRAGGLGGLGTPEYAALWFTIWQAALSAAVSVVLAIPVARALSRQQFPGRGALIALLGAPFILPVIVAVLGLLAVFGGNGLVNQIGGWLGLPRIDIYGYHGVILAHVFFNLPLATRLILQGWLAIPAERFRLAASLDAPMGRVLERPMLARIAPGAFAVIFVICLTSFAVALTLGGGPKATTVELAIYQAFKFDFDLGKTATLALVQLAMGMAAALALFALSPPDGLGAGLDRVPQRWDGRGRVVRIVDFFWIGFAALFLLTPLAMIILSGLPGLFALSADVWSSALRSLSVALGATALTILLALPLATKLGELAGLLGVAVSGLVLGTGLFLLVQPFVRPAEVALPVTLLVNALMALPFVLRILRPELDAAREDYGRLAATLGITGWALWRIVLLPRLRRPLGFAAGLTAALSMGDLGVIALFADGEHATLPFQLYQLMAAYRIEAAQGAALLLLMMSLGLFWIFDKGGRANA